MQTEKYWTLNEPHTPVLLESRLSIVRLQFSKLPVCTLLGGRFGESVQLYRAISQIPPTEMAENVAQYRRYAGQGRAGQGRAGQGRAGQGRAGRGGAGRGGAGRGGE